jgi:hypothetical protein
VSHFKAGDFLRRDGDSFTGIIKVEGYPYSDHDHDYIGFRSTETAIVDHGDICIDEAYPSRLDDRLLKLSDVAEIPLMGHIDMNNWNDEVKAFFKEAVLWCLQRELLTEEKN